MYHSLSAYVHLVILPLFPYVLDRSALYVERIRKALNLNVFCFSYDASVRVLILLCVVDLSFEIEFKHSLQQTKSHLETISRKVLCEVIERIRTIINGVKYKHF